MSFLLGLRCTLCGAEYSPDQVRYVCPHHGDEGILDVCYDYPAIASRVTRESLQANADPSIFRYLPLLPVNGETLRPPLQVGGTPLYHVRSLGAAVGLERLYLKDDTRQPTGSFKDRASAIAVMKALEAGAEVVTTASTGNAAAALAGMAASVHLPAVIFVPRTAPPAKIAQHLIYGATVLLVNGSYDCAFELTLKVAEAMGWYNRNTAFNPYMTEGKKTASLEICEQLHWQAPEVIVVPVGDGCIMGGIHKGLRDLMALGWIERMPRLIGVQAEGSSPLVEAFEKGLSAMEIKEGPASTVADSISAGLPRDRVKALRAVRETGGAFVRVSDEEILKAIPTLARHTGVFAEPAAAASFAGVQRALEAGLVRADESVVLLITGTGLKDIASAMKTVATPPVVEPTLEAVLKALAR